ncbi:hypothetical protein MUO79_03070 [Candidatus Bathyarchaeota archaeon]|nr:hypothetical protein [Candidatus Bathyarchaeota archaeon]
MSGVLKRIREFLSYAPASGSASPNGTVFYETSDIPLADVMKLYERDPTCKSSVDLLAASAVKRFYTTCAPVKDYPDAEKAKAAVDDFCETVNLDGLLHDMAVRLIACGNDFWLRLTPERLVEFVRMPVDAVEKIKLTSVQGFKIPYRVESYQLKSSYRGDVGAGVLKLEAVLHWSINQNFNSGFGVGLLQVLLHTLTVNNDKRPAFAWMKSKIERLMPRIFEKYAGPDVVVGLPGAKEDTIRRFESAIKNRPEEGAWLFHGQKDASVTPVSIDPRAQGFTFYIDHMINQFYLGCETPLPRLFSTPGFTEASARAALELQDMLIDPVQRMVKRRVEREVFAVIVRQVGFDAVKAGVRLNWGSPETPKITAADLIAAATATPPLIRPDEFRKNAVKFGWELWETKPETSTASEEGTVTRSN